MDSPGTWDPVLSYEACRIIELLQGHDYCAKAIAYKLGLPCDIVAGQLRSLRQAGFIVSEKRGRYTHYIVNTARLEAVASELLIKQPQPKSGGRCGEHKLIHPDNR